MLAKQILLKLKFNVDNKTFIILFVNLLIKIFILFINTIILLYYTVLLLSSNTKKFNSIIYFLSLISYLKY